MKFEEKLMKLRKERGWSQEDLSNQIGVSRQTISKWESSQTTPELNKLMELSKIFEISIDELVDNVLEEDENKTEEKVYAKVNLKPTYILMLIICILILIVLALGIIFLNKKEVKTYVDDVVMFTYDYTLNDKVEVIEIYSFNEKEECIGTSVKLLVKDDRDCEQVINDLYIKNEEADKILVKDNKITFYSSFYFNKTKDEVLKTKQENLNDVQNLEITDM